MVEKKKGAKKRRPSAQKRCIQSKKREGIHRAFKARMRTTMRSLRESIAKKEASAATLLSSFFKLADKGLKKGILKLNRVNRLKSRFAEQLHKRL
jgi:small subunit ribosomal protein S20